MCYVNKAFLLFHKPALNTCCCKKKKTTKLSWDRLPDSLHHISQVNWVKSVTSWQQNLPHWLLTFHGFSCLVRNFSFLCSNDCLKPRPASGYRLAATTLFTPGISKQWPGCHMWLVYIFNMAHQARRNPKGRRKPEASCISSVSSIFRGC